MKKVFMALALVAAMGLVSTNAMAWGMHGWQNSGCPVQQSTQVDAKAYQDFMASTSDLRATISADRAEVAALMAGQNPDAKQVRVLTERINKNISTLNEKATALGLPANGYMGRGMMGSGMGRGMMGRGMGRGMMGSGMGRGMMGFNGGGNGYNCPAW